MTLSGAASSSTGWHSPRVPLAGVVPLNSSAETSDGSAEASDVLVRSFIAASEHRDTESILACLTEDAVYHGMPLTPIEERAPVAAWVRRFAGKPPGRLAVRHHVATRDVVMNERTDVITVDGRTVTLLICAVFEMQAAGSRPGASTSAWLPHGRRRRGPSAASRRHCLRFGAMAYDEDLADRIRALVATERGLSEKKMFGGIAFLVGGNMAIAASGQGGILVRVDPERSDTLVATTKASVAVMRGRPMAGWLRVAADDLRTKRQLAKWVDLGTAFARSLPAKR